MGNIAGTLLYGKTRPDGPNNAYMRNKSHIIGVLPAPVHAPPMGCVKCIYRARCQDDGPACEGTILVKMSSGEVVRM